TPIPTSSFRTRAVIVWETKAVLSMRPQRVPCSSLAVCRMLWANIRSRIPAARRSTWCSTGMPDLPWPAPDQINRELPFQLWKPAGERAARLGSQELSRVQGQGADLLNQFHAPRCQIVNAAHDLDLIITCR